MTEREPSLSQRTDTSWEQIFYQIFFNEIEPKLKENKMDYDFIAALKSGMPEVAGIAVGIDRLVMLSADASG